MDDYFTKGDNSEFLVKIIANYLIDKEKLLVFDEKQIESNGVISFISKDEIKNQVLLETKLSSFEEKTRQEILKIFLKDSGDIIKNIVEQNFGDDYETYYKVHALKGICGNIGAEKLFYYTKNISFYLKQGKFPTDLDWKDQLSFIYRELEAKIMEALAK
jgi:hypothetical protein